MIRVGISGWTFPPWRGGAFYPKGLVQRRELEYASRQLNSIEINGTFYALQKPDSFQKWHDETPDDFVFSLKAPQYITHIRRLKEIDEPLANFFASGIFCLKRKLGPILWQFPPSLTLKDDRFERFVTKLPRDFNEASLLAKRHSSKMGGRAVVKPLTQGRLRHAIEVRHPSFLNPDFIDLLRAHNVALVFGHSGGLSAPYIEDITADFIYIRMHGQRKEFKKGHTEIFLKEWGSRVQLWSNGKQPRDSECILESAPKLMNRDVFIYFDTDAKKYAPADAIKLSQILKIQV